MKLLSVLILLVTIMGCNTHQYEEVYPEHRFNTMLVINEGIDQIRVYEGNGVGYSIAPNQARCIPLRNSNSAVMNFSILGQRGKWYTPEQSYQSGQGWLWVINPSNAALSTTRIIESEPCNVGDHYTSNHVYYNAYQLYAYSYYSTLTFRPYYVYGYGYDYYISWNYWNRPNYVFVRYVEHRPTVVAQARPRSRAVPSRKPINGENRGRRVVPTSTRRNMTARAPTRSPNRAVPSTPRRVTRTPARVTRTPARAIRTPTRVVPRRSQPQRSVRPTPQRRPSAPRRTATTTRRRKP